LQCNEFLNHNQKINPTGANPMPTFKRFILLWISATLALWIVDAAFDSLHFDDPQSMILSGLILALVNVTLKPLLVLITLPITLLSFGLALPVLNGLVLLGIAALVPGFEISGFWMGVLCALAVSLVSMLINVATGQTGVRGQLQRGVRVEIHRPASGRSGQDQDKTVIDVETREKP
jgi:putative membrane protein